MRVELPELICENVTDSKSGKNKRGLSQLASNSLITNTFEQDFSPIFTIASAPGINPIPFRVTTVGVSIKVKVGLKLKRVGGIVFGDNDAEGEGVGVVVGIILGEPDGEGEIPGFGSIEFGTSTELPVSLQPPICNRIIS